MKSPITAALVVALTFAMTQAANAQSEVGRWYLGGSIVQTTVDDYCDSGAGVTVTNCSDDDTSFKLYGGRNVHKNFAVEFGYIDFGEVKGTGTTSRISLPVKSSAESFFIAGIGKIHIHPKAALFGKIGLHRWDAEVETTVVDIGDDSVDFFYGIGGEVAPFPKENIKLRLEYEMFSLDDIDNSDVDADLDSLSLGITYTF